MSLSTHSSVSLSIVARYMTLGLQFVSTLILARLLTPEDIGIYTAGFSMVALAHLFRDFGFNQYLIQERQLTKDKVETSFTLSVFISWGLGALLLLSAPWAAQLVDEPKVKLLVQLLSINFFIIPFGAIAMALLRKALKFHITAGIGIVTTLAGMAVTLATAYQGHGYLCLAYGAITETLLTAILASLVKTDNVSLRFNLKGARHILAFGSVVGITNIITHFSDTAKNVIITRAMGATLLGFFSRAEGATKLFDMIFASAIRPIVLPLYSGLNHMQSLLLDAYYKTCHYAFALAWPFFAFLLIHTDTVILTLYGDQWGPAIPLTRILCIGFMCIPPVIFIDALLIANGTPKANMKTALAFNLLQVLLLVIAGIFGTIYDITILVSAMVAVRTLMYLAVLRRVVGVSLREMATIALANIPCLLFAIVPTIIARPFVLAASDVLIVQFAMLLLISAIGWFAALILSEHELLDELLRLARIRKAPVQGKA
ncbi:MAG: hypothetical protein CSA53_01390 [Gammaproteobacteria bacterium]|nr:MAG: hypothetical protein CSA53_01390 [Gammaproteobacteria bacterium]